MTEAFKTYIEEYLAKKFTNSLEWAEMQKRFRKSLFKSENESEVNAFFQAVNDLMAQQNYIAYSEGLSDGITLKDYHKKYEYD